MSHGEPARPLVSVIVRTRDRLEPLGEALASVAAQTYRPLEAVVVNDGGAPVGGVVDRVRDRLAVRLVEHPEPRGRAAAANAGVRAAAGEWVAFLDDDDLYLPEHVATVMEAARREGVELAYAACRVLHPAAGPEGEVLARPFDPEALAIANSIPTCAVVVRREAVLAVGGFDEELEFLEDWELWLRLAARGRFAFVPEVTSVYRAGPASVGGDMAGERWAAMVRVLERHWEKVRPGALVRRLHELERDIAALRAELLRVAGDAEAAERGRAEAVAARDRLAARVAELEAREAALGDELERLRAEHRELAAVVSGAMRLRIAPLLARLGRRGGGGEG